MQVVVGIEGKQVGQQHAASGSEGQADAAFVLLLILGGTEGLGERHRWRAAHRKPTDGAAGIQIPLKQGLRHPQHTADVVETIAGVICRQEVIDVDLQCQQIANGVAIFGPIQAVEGGRPSRVGMGRGGTIELGLEPGAEPIERRWIGPG